MRRKLYIGMISLVLLGLVGCTSGDTTKKAKDNVATVQTQEMATQNDQDKPQETQTESTSTQSQNRQAESTPTQSANTLAENNLEQSQAATGLTKLEINNEVGDTKIAIGKEDLISVKAEAKIQGANSEAQKKEILDQIILVQEKNAQTASYYVTAKGSKKTQLGSWLRATYGNKLNLNITLTVVIPESISSFSLVTGVGAIRMIDSDLSGSISVGVGDVYLEQVSLIGKMDITSGTGNIKLAARKIDQAQSIHAVTGVGDLAVTVPEKASYSVDITAFMKDRVKQDYNGGGPLFTLVTGVGNVKLTEMK
ncbi:MAG: hypothetical protein K6T85_16875 [Gorillibacterium sp.]|nr:hypothetical protein [Gorillibacterium sp.]